MLEIIELQIYGSIDFLFFILSMWNLSHWTGLYVVAMQFIGYLKESINIKLWFAPCCFILKINK